MGLLSTEVEVKLGGSNIQYYESLGYEIPKYYDKKYYKTTVKRGSTIMVKVKDLSKGSNALVDIEYDCCHKIRKMQYGAYHTRNHDGKIYCQSCANSILNIKENNWKWNPNITEEERIIGRDYLEYHIFVKKVLERDNYICQCCGEKCNGNAEVHHLDGYDWCIEKRTDETNGITLCSTCHLNFHIKYGRGENTKEQYEDWVGKAISDLKTYNGVLPTAKKIYDYEANKIYDSAEQCSKIYGTTPTAVYNCCNRKISKTKRKKKDGTIIYRTERVVSIKGHHLFWLEEYENMSKKEVELLLESLKCRRYTKVVCITTGEIFERIAHASKKYDIHKSTISSCCRGERNTAGKLDDGTPLKWMNYENFSQLSEIEQQEILSRNKDSLNDGSFNM